MVAVTYNEGILPCEEHDKLNGDAFKIIMERNFEEMFQRAKKNASRLWIQDGDLSQNRAIARRSFTKMNTQLISIPSRSPDVNPIENIFHIVKKKLDDDALRRCIHREDYSAFRGRVCQTIFDLHKNVINKTIESMEHGMEMIIKEKGRRLKYQKNKWIFTSSNVINARGAGFRIIINRLETLRNWNISLSTARIFFTVFR